MRLLWSQIASLPLAELKHKLQQLAKEVGTVTLRDLLAPSPSASTGLYFFFEADRCLYVGRARSRAIIERIPSHLDMRPEGWFGTLLKYLAREANSTPEGVVESALRTRVAVIFKDSSAGRLEAAETALRHAFEPLLNSPKRRKTVGRTLAEIAE